ncbi:MAG: HlyD family efflux transporter periplasmic adaptor subunit [Proteobacteria bacterium]|nr:HlyD family efflux transporter periplasmic adaptor subunit [Desulfobulbaceae bacterium]MBU4152216.1 HlyD family efflux transporter periplasmic adaptor subunit [Pseudomonadota bacterium]
MIPLRPTLREDLQIIPRHDEEGRCRYLLKDPISTEVFDFGAEEHFLCERFDGVQQLPAVREAFAASFGVVIATESLEAFVRYLGALGLLKRPTGEETVAAHDQGMHYRLCNPDRFLGVFASLFSWCFSWVGLAVVGMLAFFALGVAMRHGSDFIFGLRFIPKEELVLAIPLYWILFINPLSETAKALSCRVNGGHVYEFCFSWVFRVVPHFFVNVSEVFWVMDKAARMRVLRAGLIVQIFLVSVGLLFWNNVDPATPLQTFFVIFTLAATANLFFNALPFIQKDGYFLLATYLEDGNLWDRARALVKSWVLRRPLPEPLSRQEQMRFKWFGGLFYIVQYGLLYILMGIAGYQLMTRLKGIGALLFMVILVLRFEPFLAEQFRKLRSLIPLPRFGNQVGRVWLSRLVWIICLMGIVLVCFLPYPYEVGGNFRIVPATQYGVRAQVEGEIETVLVGEGQVVKAGELIAKIRERDYRMKVEATQASVDDLQARLNLLKEGKKPEEIALAEQQVNSATKSFDYSSAQARRYEDMFKNRAVSAEDRENIMRTRDLDLERLELARRNLILQKSGPRSSEIQALEAELRLQEVLLAHAKQDLVLTSVLSPIDGRVITPNIQQIRGQRLMEGDLLLVIEDTSFVRAEVEISEDDISDVTTGSEITFRAWSDPLVNFQGKVEEIAPVAYDKSLKRVRRALSLKEETFEQREILRDQGKAVRLLCALDLPEDAIIKTDMTGWAKIESAPRPVGVAFTRWFMRFLFVEVWSWIP